MVNKHVKKVLSIVNYPGNANFKYSSGSVPSLPHAAPLLAWKSGMQICTWMHSDGLLGPLSWPLGLNILNRDSHLQTLICARCPGAQGLRRACERRVGLLTVCTL